MIPSWLTPVTLQFRVDLLGEPTELIEVAKRAWAKQSIDVEASLAKVNVSGVGKWLSLIHRAQKGVKMKLSVPSELLDFSLVAVDMSPVAFRVPFYPTTFGAKSMKDIIWDGSLCSTTRI